MGLEPHRSEDTQQWIPSGAAAAEVTDIDRARALTEEFRANRITIYEIARRVCGEDSAADVTQEVFLRVWKHPEQFDASRGSMRSYLLTVSRGVAIDFLRRDTARRIRDDRLISQNRETHLDIGQRLARKEAITRVAKALDQLSHSERDAIVAAFYEDITYREVAVQLGVPEGTVKSRIRHGLQKLRTELQDLRHDPAV